jgi:hypothetical protein
MRRDFCRPRGKPHVRLSRCGLFFNLAGNWREGIDPMRKVATLAVLGLAWASQAFAGVMYEEEIICPVGQEKFKAMRFAACAAVSGVSVYEIVACKPLVDLPVCPSNGLPLYRDFSTSEVERLTAFVDTDEYRALQDKSPYLRAHAIEEYLVGKGSAEAFWLLHFAFCGDAEALRDEPGFIDAYLGEATLEKDRASPQDKPYLMSATAHQLAYAGRDSEAKAWLDEARAAADAANYEGAHLHGYIDDVAGCIGKARAEECRPGISFGQ